MTGLNYKLANARLYTLIFLVISFCASAMFSQTVENPVDVKIKLLTPTIRPGDRSAIEIIFKIPRGFWLGSNDPSTRLPAPTTVVMKQMVNFTFEKPLFPKPKVVGIPVHKGTSRIFKGEIHVIVPFTVYKNAPDGKYKIIAYVTYQPGLNAGSLTTHVDEEYSVEISVNSRYTTKSVEIPPPSVQDVPKDYMVIDKEAVLPSPLDIIMYRWPENTTVPDVLHWLFIDPPNHGKHIQTVWVPFVGFTENNGGTLGMGVSLLNVTREGIMTGQVQLRGFYNEYVGTTFAMELVTCPAAYFNYWLSAQYSVDGKNKGIQFHMENLTIGKHHRFGYEVEAKTFQDPRYRFYGTGAGTKEEDKTNYTHSENSVVLDFYWMPLEHWRFSVGGKYKSVNVKDGNDKLLKIMPWTTEFTVAGKKWANIPGIQGATVAGGRINVVYDGRNSEFTPSDGFYGKVTAEYNNVTDQVVTTSNPADNYGKFSADFREYISTANQVLTLLIRNSWTFTTDENVPFFDQATFGGDFSDRGFDNGRFYGQNSVFASMEVRLQLMHIVFMGIPMDIEMAPFLDGGQVFNSDGFHGRFNINPGMSVRILNRPNLGIVGNAAIGQDGLIFTGGVTLPF